MVCLASCGLSNITTWCDHMSFKFFGLQVRDQLAMRRPAPNIPSGPRHFHRPLSAAERDELMAVQHRDRMRHLQMQQGRQTGPSGGTARSPEPR